MGNLCSVEGAIDHWLYIKTGDRKSGCNNVTIKVILYDVKGGKSPEIALSCNFNNDFERGQTDTFQCPPLGNMGDMNVIEFWLSDHDTVSDWFLESVMVNDARKEKCFYFPVHRWIRPEKHYMITSGDTSLPQNDPYPEQRSSELKEKRALYQYSQQAPDLPVQVGSALLTRFCAKGAWSSFIPHAEVPQPLWFLTHGSNHLDRYQDQE